MEHVNRLICEEVERVSSCHRRPTMCPDERYYKILSPVNTVRSEVKCLMIGEQSMLPFSNFSFFFLIHSRILMVKKNV